MEKNMDIEAEDGVIWGYYRIHGVGPGGATSITGPGVGSIKGVGGLVQSFIHSQMRNPCSISTQGTRD